jgi:methylenetetrahydrofolate dehydrogenase (NADP+) / methenyltetrahydrofolate cyclohydrolase
MLLYGKPVAEKIYENLQKEIADNSALKSKPMLAVVLVGENPASLTYIKVKEKVAEKLGVGFKLYHLMENALQKDIEKLISDLDQNKYVSGIVVQLPLPKNIETEKIIGLINPDKDVDGFKGKFSAPTAAAILEILSFYRIDIKNKTIVIVGRGRLVGKPLERELQKQNIKPIICDKTTENLKEKTLSADILISAVGVPGLITLEMVKKDTIIIDAGTSEAGGKMVGDVAPEVYQIAETYTPTPGGVGPVTVAELYKNLAKAVK